MRTGWFEKGRFKMSNKPKDDAFDKFMHGVLKDPDVNEHEVRSLYADNEEGVLGIAHADYLDYKEEHNAEIVKYGEDNLPKDRWAPIPELLIITGNFELDVQAYFEIGEFSNDDKEACLNWLLGKMRGRIKMLYYELAWNDKNNKNLD